MIFHKSIPVLSGMLYLFFIRLSRYKAHKIPPIGIQKLGRNMVKVPIDNCCHIG